MSGLPDKATYEERVRRYRHDMDMKNLFFNDEKHPFRCTGFKPEEQHSMSEDIVRAVPTMQNQLRERLQEAFDDLGCTLADVAEFWGLKPTSHKEVSKAIKEPENLSADKCVRLCATLGVAPSCVRGYHESGVYGSRAGSFDMMTGEEIADCYLKLDDEGKRTVTTTIRSLLQSQRANEHYLTFATMLMMSQHSGYWDDIDVGDWLAGLRDGVLEVELDDNGNRIMKIR